MKVKIFLKIFKHDSNLLFQRMKSASQSQVSVKFQLSFKVGGSMIIYTYIFIDEIVCHGRIFLNLISCKAQDNYKSTLLLDRWKCHEQLFMANMIWTCPRIRKIKTSQQQHRGIVCCTVAFLRYLARRYGFYNTKGLHSSVSGTNTEKQPLNI